MTKQDITMHSDMELSLLVFNTEWLYNNRRRPRFIDRLKELYIFTDEQLDVLKQDLEADMNEDNEAV